MSAGHINEVPVQLRDNIVGRVIPRDRARHKGMYSIMEGTIHIPLDTVQHSGSTFQPSTTPPLWLPSTSTGGTAVSNTAQIPPSPLSRPPVDNTRPSGPNHLRIVEEMDKLKNAIRREKLRKYQARYRDRQRALQQLIHYALRQLHEEVQSLKLKRQYLGLKEKPTRSPWRIVSDVFRIVELGFHYPWNMINVDEMRKHAEMQPLMSQLKNAFEEDVGMGDLHGASWTATSLLTVFH
ncbi:hypothetical protein GN244_ATG01694 [Phytophthora infestans]|uniref:Bzip transcription factor n=1 Tax=Phytophthora infestans TaxID=4787 RepID=A0A833TDM2_PHYIN|nr:hypothetical protein GN244_ATG01694 [Phytophthora infestans]KAF4133617.1 hypothetical protein GN958_ATG16954 [Phytophthora infestans]